MKTNWSSFSCLLMLSFWFFGCSKQTTPESKIENNQTTSLQSVTLNSVYVVKLGNNGAWFVSEFENTGNTSIMAFKGKWILSDDLGEEVSSLVIRYASDTPFLSKTEGQSKHIIAPHEKFVIVNQGIKTQFGGEELSTFAGSKDDIEQYALKK